MNLATARRIADKCVELLAPYCERIEIAGSIRRQRPEVADVDLVVLPNAENERSFVAFLESNYRVVTSGPQNVILQGAKTQLDIFIARRCTADLFDTKPTNFGSLLLCRTGSKEHNIFLVQHAKRIGKRWNPYQGVFCNGMWQAGELADDPKYVGGQLQASVTEEEIFAALNLEFVPPERRER